MDNLNQELIITDSTQTVTRKESLSEIHGYDLKVKDLSIWAK